MPGPPLFGCEVAWQPQLVSSLKVPASQYTALCHTVACGVEGEWTMAGVLGRAIERSREMVSVLV